MCKEGWYAGLGQEGHTLKGGGTKKRGGNKDFRKESKLGQGVGSLKKGGWNPLTNYEEIRAYFKISTLPV